MLLADMYRLAGRELSQFPVKTVWWKAVWYKPIVAVGFKDSFKASVFQPLK
jgi:hypothetical protein